MLIDVKGTKSMSYAGENLANYIREMLMFVSICLTWVILLRTADDCFYLFSFLILPLCFLPM